MATANVTVNGQTITASTFADHLKSVKSAAAKLGIIAQASGKQAALFQNFDWINRLFSAESPLVKRDGELSVQGKAVKAYIAFHVPSIKIEKDKESAIWKASHTKSKKNRGTFVSDVVEGEKVFSESADVDFYFDFEAWQNRAKGKGGDDKLTAKKAEKAAGRAVTQLDKILEEWAELEGGTDDLHALQVKANELAATAAALSKAARDRMEGKILEAAQDVSAEMATQAASAAPQASKRADTDREEHAATA